MLYTTYSAFAWMSNYRPTEINILIHIYNARVHDHKIYNDIWCVVKNVGYSCEKWINASRFYKLETYGCEYTSAFVLLLNYNYNIDNRRGKRKKVLDINFLVSEQKFYQGHCARLIPLLS